MPAPIKVCLTGAAGQIAYSLVFAIARGDVFGKDQEIILTLLDIEPMLKALDGVIMELQDCAFPLLKEVIPTADPNVGFKDIDAVFMVGAFPRKDGMQRKDLLEKNAGIFVVQGKALDAHAKKSVKVLVVGNPANTNSLIAAENAPSIPNENFTALTRLDQNRSCGQIAARLKVSPKNVRNVIIWGNHSATQYPDVNHATVIIDGKTVSVRDAVKDDNWFNGDFITTVQKRGAAIIKARGLSSAASAANAACDHMRDWWFGTAEGQWVSMGVMSDGKHYGIYPGLIYSMPVKIKDGKWEIVDGLNINDFSRERMDITRQELMNERDTAFGKSGK